MAKNLILPVDKVKSFEDHFIDNSWASPQDQIDATYPIFIQPTLPTAQFIYTHDLGVLIAENVLISATVPVETVAGTVTYTCTLETSTDDVTYTTHPIGNSVFTSGFQYIRIQLDFAATDDHGVARIRPIRLRVSLKRKHDFGHGTSSATLPVTVTFNRSFYDVDSITVAAQFSPSYPVIAVYDFVDVPNPTTFDVYCFRSDTGAQVVNDFSWRAEGA